MGEHTTRINTRTKFPPLDVEITLGFDDGHDETVRVRGRVPMRRFARVQDDLARAAKDGGENAATDAIIAFVRDALHPDDGHTWDRFIEDQAADYQTVMGLYTSIVGALAGARPTAPASSSSDGSPVPVTGGFVTVPSRQTPAEASNTGGIAAPSGSSST